jgi:hypothetical protein
MLNKALDYVVDRLGEKSTYQGLAYLLTAAGVAFNPEYMPHIMSLGLGLAGILQVLKKEKKF